MSFIIMMQLLLLSTLALAAPLNDIRKRTFAIPARGFIDPGKALTRAQHKWGTVFDDTVTSEETPVVTDLSGLFNLLHLPTLSNLPSLLPDFPDKVLITLTMTEIVTPTAKPSHHGAQTSTISILNSAVYSGISTPATTSAEASSTTPALSTLPDSSISTPIATSPESSSTDAAPQTVLSSTSSASATASLTSDTTLSTIPYISPITSSAAAPSVAASSVAASSVASSSVVSSSESFSTGSSSTASSSTASSSTGPSSTAPSSSASSGEVVASPEANDKAYLSPVTIGGQTLDLDFDTGSADLWVFSSSLPASEIGSHAAYDSSKSSTWTAYDGGSWNITYGDGSFAYGKVGYDTVSIGGVIAAKQCVEIATNISNTFRDDVQNDGLLGLGFSVVNTVKPQQQKTFFENVKDSLAEPLFTVDLDKNAAGTFEFGVIDSSKYTGDIHWAPVDSSAGFWQFESQSYSVGGTVTQCAACNPAIADTGTSLMLMDPSIVKAYYAQVQGATYDSSSGGYTYDCGASLPDFGVSIGSSYMAVVKGEDMTYMATGTGNKCFGGLQATSAHVQVLGDMFLKSYFSIFDGGNMRFGVAAKA